MSSDVVAGVTAAARRAHGLAGSGERILRLLEGAVGRRHRAADLDDSLWHDDGGVLLVLLVVELVDVALNYEVRVFKQQTVSVDIPNLGNEKDAQSWTSQVTT